MSAVAIPRPASRFAVGTGEVAGAVADAGVFVPLVAALVLVNGLDAGAVLVGAGLLVVGSGAWFGIPFPVQPLKALTTVAVAQRLSPDVIHAAGLEIAVLLVLLSVRGVADVVARVFTPTTVRALQLGVGLLLVFAAARLVLDPPQAMRVSGAEGLLAVAALGAVAVAAHRRRFGVVVAVVGASVAVAWLAAGGAMPSPGLRLPAIGLPPASAFGAAFALLVVPQIPLTFGNAVVAVTRLSHETFGARAARVTPAAVARSCGIGNAVAAVLGGMPMCHGAGGLTAHVRLGARTAGMNLILGGALLVAGLLFAGDVPALLGLFPAWLLAALLAHAGLRHALLVSDRRGPGLAIAVAAGIAGAALGNLAVTALVALVADHLWRLSGRRRERVPAA